MEMNAMKLQDLTSSSLARPMYNSLPLADPWRSTAPYTTYPSYFPPPLAAAPAMHYLPSFSPTSIHPVNSYLSSSPPPCHEKVIGPPGSSPSPDTRSHSIASLRMRAKEHLESLGKGWSQPVA